MKNQRNYLRFWIGVLILSIFMAVSCEKEPCDCGTVISNTNDGKEWTVVIDFCGEHETQVWHFPLDEFEVGDTVCKLKEIDLNELNCKP